MQEACFVHRAEALAENGQDLLQICYTKFAAEHRVDCCCAGVKAEALAGTGPILLQPLPY